MKALIVVDVQNDFLPGGALAVPDGDQVIPVINSLMNYFEMIIATQDWHPPGHESFASSHFGKKPGEVIDLHGLQQILWPDHCIQGSFGAAFSNELRSDLFARAFTKGTDPGIDSYSGFFDNGHLTSTGLDEFLKAEKIATLYITGLATDYCVKYTALDAHQLGYETYIVQDATRAVNLHPNDYEKTLGELESASVKSISAKDIIS